MRLCSWNVNGLRAIEKKGALQELLSSHNPDILFLQEIKCNANQLSTELTQHPEYFHWYHSAKKPGYAGTGIWLKKNGSEPSEFFTGMPNFIDDEGRVSRVDIGEYSFFGIYFPNGGKSEEAWKEKLVFYDLFLEYINSLRREGKKIIWAGDINCAHEEIDLARPKENMNSIGFLPEERIWITRVIADNWIDIFRSQYPKEKVYSWWHVISGARARNIGWRIDYFFCDATLLPKVKEISYLTEQYGSDHCPVFLDIEL
jgi:exodeoxyribonuclease III